MKKTLQLIALGIVYMLMVSCQSKEERATKVIKNELYKTLYDFESYEPIETIVTEAKMTMYNDSVCWAMAAVLAYRIEEVDEYFEEAENAKERMDLWGIPTYYSSQYSDNQYYKYKEEYEKNAEQFRIALNACKGFAKELKEQIAKLDTEKIVGWEVKHRFRCNTRGGSSTIADYRYVLDKDFKKIILQEDIGDDDTFAIRNILEFVANGDLDE